ncbi:Na+/H+ antiporter NhaC family protein [Virgibacillus necropolis]|uniref:Sodium:proton exchanger n=1 Tax=Virgibacillus necropolis TaxID=163877 RepID=A0A221MEU9_9BACI|nr:Na+/H+ antiporter NhaC family protein [Virgibacillus necropolis]ASN06177.1 sodium:proton exchanger [Virgibacillus necropolis]
MDHLGVLSLAPPIIAIVLALWTRNVIISLFLGLFSGILILSHFNPLSSVKTVIGDYFFVQIADSYNAGILALLVFIGGFVALLEKSGGAAAFASKITSLIRTRVQTQLSAWIGGIAIFFSELGTPLIIGPIFEPLFDKAKVSREKLAWIIDSTASPVSVMIPFIGWGVYIIGLINTEYGRLNITESGWDAFIQAIPYYIYPILAVLIVPLIVITKLEFGPMAKAERRIQETGQVYWPDSKPMRKSEAITEIKETSSKPILVWLPILILLVTIIGLLIPLGFPFKKIDGNDFRVALTTAYLFAGISLIVLMTVYKVKRIAESFEIYVSGMRRMMDILIILVLAWSLGAALDKMGTANYIVQLIDGNIPLFLVPAIIFVVGACMSFANGTSWGTFAIMLPLAIPLAFHLDISMYACIGAVISGGIFGDHCSPISDTTILSSTGAGSDHKDHNKTQLPIALFNGVLTIIAFVVGSLVGYPTTIFIAVTLMVIGVLLLSKLYNRRTPPSVDKFSS